MKFLSIKYYLFLATGLLLCGLFGCTDTSGGGAGAGGTQTRQQNQTAEFKQAVRDALEAYAKADEARKKAKESSENIGTIEAASLPNKVKLRNDEIDELEQHKTTFAAEKAKFETAHHIASVNAVGNPSELADLNKKKSEMNTWDSELPPTLAKGVIEMSPLFIAKVTEAKTAFAKAEAAQGKAAKLAKEISDLLKNPALVVSAELTAKIDELDLQKKSFADEKSKFTRAFANALLKETEAPAEKPEIEELGQEEGKLTNWEKSLPPSLDKNKILEELKPGPSDIFKEKVKEAKTAFAKAEAAQGEAAKLAEEISDLLKKPGEIVPATLTAKIDELDLQRKSFADAKSKFQKAFEDAGKQKLGDPAEKTDIEELGQDQIKLTNWEKSLPPSPDKNKILEQLKPAPSKSVFEMVSGPDFDKNALLKLIDETDKAALESLRDKNHDNRTLLMALIDQPIAYDQQAVILQLLEKAPDLATMTDDKGNTPLHAFFSIPENSSIPQYRGTRLDDESIKNFYWRLKLVMAILLDGGSFWAENDNKVPAIRSGGGKVTSQQRDEFLNNWWPEIVINLMDSVEKEVIIKKQLEEWSKNNPSYQSAKSLVLRLVGKKLESLARWFFENPNLPQSAKTLMRDIFIQNAVLSRVAPLSYLSVYGVDQPVNMDPIWQSPIKWGLDVCASDIRAYPIEKPELLSWQADDKNLTVLQMLSAQWEKNRNNSRTESSLTDFIDNFSKNCPTTDLKTYASKKSTNGLSAVEILERLKEWSILRQLGVQVESRVTSWKEIDDISLLRDYFNRQVEKSKSNQIPNLFTSELLAGPSSISRYGFEIRPLKELWYIVLERVVAIDDVPLIKEVFKKLDIREDRKYDENQTKDLMEPIRDNFWEYRKTSNGKEEYLSKDMMELLFPYSVWGYETNEDALKSQNFKKAQEYGIADESKIEQWSKWGKSHLTF